jgi:hypothetical protein
VVPASILVGASFLTPLGFFGCVLVPVWLLVVGIALFRTGRRPVQTRANDATDS